MADNKISSLSQLCSNVAAHLDCGPTGNYVTSKFRSLKKAKYQLQLTKPMGTPFVKEYDIALNTSKNMRNFIVANGKNENFHFTKDMFEKKMLPADAETAVDNKMEHWPILDIMHNKLDAIKYKYKAQPVPAYTMDNVFVEPAAVIDTIAGTLVHVQFELVHYHISK
ncbi:hypothetical protein EI94DRAFT_1874428 [Lactarius quietus]|nr:hypothetical protein EI94DRAFT_1874428 [Lactarius quietus]